MKYRFYGDKVQIIRYIANRTYGDGLTETMDIATDAERDAYIARYPDATVEAIDNAGYEWLDGMTFTQEQIQSGEVEKAIELGEDGYREYKAATDQDTINAMLLLEIARLKAGDYSE